MLAPLVHWLAQSLAGEFPKLAHSGFHRYVSRSIEGLAVLGLWPLLRSLGANSWRELGLVSPKGHGKELGGGFALGFVSLAVVGGVLLIALVASVLMPGKKMQDADRSATNTPGNGTR